MSPSPRDEAGARGIDKAQLAFRKFIAQNPLVGLLGVAAVAVGGWYAYKRWVA